MARGYNWAELKKEYFASDHLEVSTWHEHTNSTVPRYNNKSLRVHTIGWMEEKKKWLEQKTKRTIQKMLEKESEANADALIHVLKHLQKISKNPNVLKRMNVRDIKELWNIWRVENKLPNKISNELVGEDPDHKFSTLADAFKALAKIKEQKHEPKA